MVSYKIIDLGLPRGYSLGTGVTINESGQALCALSISSRGLPKPAYAALWHNNQLHPVGQFDAKGLNNKGQIVGGRVVKPSRGFFIPGLLSSWACMFSNGRLIDLGKLPQTLLSTATAINNSGMIAGQIYTGDSTQSLSSLACFWLAESITGVNRLDTPPGVLIAEPLGINDRSQIVGKAKCKPSSEATKGVTEMGILWTQGVAAMLLPIADWDASNTVAINNQGVAVGMSYRQKQQLITTTQACLWHGNQAQSLGVLYPGGSTQALDVNDHMQIVGTASSSKNMTDSAAFLWEQGKMNDLNRIIQNGSGCTLVSAMSINNHGEILCNGIYHHGAAQEMHAVLLQPQ